MSNRSMIGSFDTYVSGIFTYNLQYTVIFVKMVIVTHPAKIYHRTANVLSSCCNVHITELLDVESCEC